MMATQDPHMDTIRWSHGYYQDMDKRTLHISGYGQKDTIMKWTIRYYQDMDTMTLSWNGHKDTSLEQVFVLEVFCPLDDDRLLVLHPAVPLGPRERHHGRCDGHLAVDIVLHDDTLRNNNQSGPATQLLIKRRPFVIDAHIRNSFQCNIYEHIFLQVKLNWKISILSSEGQRSTHAPRFV